MTNQTNTGSGSIAQGHGSTAAGERGVAADKILGSTIATGDNPTINNIVIVGRLLEFAQVEGLLPQIKDRDFSSVTEAIEGAFKSYPNTDLAQAVAFAGEVLGELITEKLDQTKTSSSAFLKVVVEAIPKHVYSHWLVSGYWSIYSETVNGSSYSLFGKGSVLWLDSTTMLFEKRFGKLGRLGIYSNFSINFVYNAKTDIKTLPIIHYDVHKLRILLIGVVLDIIRIKCDDEISHRLLEELSDLLETR